MTSSPRPQGNQPQHGPAAEDAVDYKEFGKEAAEGRQAHNGKRAQQKRRRRQRHRFDEAAHFGKILRVQAVLGDAGAKEKPALADAVRHDVQARPQGRRRCPSKRPAG